LSALDGDGGTGDLPTPPNVPRIPPTPLFSALPKRAFVEIVVDMKMHRFEPGDRLIEEGAPGDSFFVLCSGRVRVEKRAGEGPPIVLAYLADGAFFGEMALFQQGPRTASVIAEEPSELLEIDRALLDKTASRYPSVAKVLRDFYKQRLLATTMMLHPFFKPFTPNERRNLVEMFRSRAFLANEVLIEEGGKGQGLYLLLSGRLEVSKTVPSGKLVLAELGAGDVFGEMSLLVDQPTVATVRAVEDSWVVRLAKNRFGELVRARPELLDPLKTLLEGRLDTNRALLSKQPSFSADGAVLV
jgi:CRP-like cAMP-binding protein